MIGQPQGAGGPWRAERPTGRPGARFVLLFSVALLLLLAQAATLRRDWQVIYCDEYLYILTVQQVAEDGSTWLTPSRVDFYNKLYTRDEYQLRPSPVTGGTCYKYAGPGVALAALLYRISPKLYIYHNLVWLALALWILRRIQVLNERPDGNYLYAALFLTFGSSYCAFAWANYAPHALYGCVLLAMVYYLRRALVRDVLPVNLQGCRQSGTIAVLLFLALLLHRPDSGLLAALVAGWILWSWRQLWSARVLARAFGLAMLGGGLVVAASNWLKSGNVLSNGEGVIEFGLAGFAGIWTDPSENILLVNLPLLLLFTDWRAMKPARHYLGAGLLTLAFYLSWWCWNAGFQRLAGHALPLLAAGLLFVRLRGFAWTLLAISLFFCSLLAWIPYYDYVDAMRLNEPETMTAEAWLAPEYLRLLLKGWWWSRGL